MNPVEQPIKLSLKKGKVSLLTPVELAEIQGGSPPAPPTTPVWGCVSDFIEDLVDDPQNPSPHAGTC